MAKPTREDASLILQAATYAAQSGMPGPMTFTYSDEFNPDYKQFIREHPAGSAAYDKAIRIAVYFEGLGTMWKHGLINEDLLFDWIAVHPVWERMKGFVLGQREAAGEPRLGENFEAMAKASAAWGAKSAPRRTPAASARTLVGKARSKSSQRTKRPAPRGRGVRS